MTIIQAIPYKSFKEKIRIVKETMNKGFRVEIAQNYIYAEKYIEKEDCVNDRI